MPKNKPKTTKRTHKKEFPRSREKRTEKFWKELNKVIDPELNIGIVDLGLIYDIEISKDGEMVVVMTLTTPTCPMGPQIIAEVEAQMLKQKEVKKIYTEIVWEPFWNEKMMDPTIRMMIMGD